MDQLMGKDSEAKTPTGLGLSTYLCCPAFWEKVYRVTGHLKATHAAQVPPKFRVNQPNNKASVQSKPSLTDNNIANLEIQLWVDGTIPSCLIRTGFSAAYYSWCNSFPHHMRTTSHTFSTTSKNSSSHHLEQNIMHACACHLLFNTVLRYCDVPGRHVPETTNTLQMSTESAQTGWSSSLWQGSMWHHPGDAYTGLKCHPVVAGDEPHQGASLPFCPA